MNKIRSMDFIEFENMAHNNILRVMDEMPEDKNIYYNINGLFDKINNCFADKSYSEENYTPIFFLTRCHNSFLAAGRLAFSGQLECAYMVIRGALENALYAYYIYKNPELSKIWWMRHESEDHKKEVKKKFILSRMIDSLATNNNFCFKTVKYLYEKTITFGAHPNVLGMGAVTKRIEKDDKFIFHYDYLTGNTRPFDVLLVDVLDLGLICLLLFQFVFKTEYEKMGIEKELKELYIRLYSYARAQGVQAT